jgi:Tripartite ATP-independent periplasmic transporter, DctM component
MMHTAARLQNNWCTYQLTLQAPAARLRRGLFILHAPNAFVCHLRGGLAMATVGACAAFGGPCGSSMADCVRLAILVAFPTLWLLGVMR